MIDPFFEGATQSELDSLHHCATVFRAKPTGSRWYEPMKIHPTRTDFDCVGYLYDRRDLDALLVDGWEAGGSHVPENDFMSLRKGRVNLILCRRYQFFSDFILATHLCRRLGGCLNRRQRVLVFRSILYRQLPGAKPPEESF